MSNAVKNVVYSSVQELIDEASRCVACGQCVPLCPTYRKTLDENESPRGRIALMQAVLQDRIPLNQRFVEHIDLCLTCRACEKACPSNVQVGQLVNGMRSVMAPALSVTRWQRLRRRVALKTLTRPTIMSLIGYLAKFYQTIPRRLTRNSWLLKKLGIAELEAKLPQVKRPKTWKTIYPAVGIAQGEVSLFLGCVARLLDADTLDACIFVLNRLGYTVHIPGNQTCCGAVHLHAGETEWAMALAERNLDAFAKQPTVLYSASGCGAMLSEYRQTGSSILKFEEISHFLTYAAGWDKVTIQPLTATVAVHDPCTLRNVINGADSIYKLLARIPGLIIKPLPGNEQCCGAAGIYYLTQTKMADALLDDKLAAATASAVRYIATSNIGCALHLDYGLKRDELDIEVVHPITLLARQMGYQA